MELHSVKTGDICKQGDILVSGEVPILNDSQEVVRVEYVPADADIYVRHQIAYYQEFPLSYEKKIPNGSSISWYVHVETDLGADTGRDRHSLQKSCPGKSQRILSFLFQLSNHVTPYKLQKTVYTKKQAENKAATQLKRYQKQLLEREIQIVDSDVSTIIDGVSCVTKGTLTVDEVCGKRQPAAPDPTPK